VKSKTYPWDAIVFLLLSERIEKTQIKPQANINPNLEEKLDKLNFSSSLFCNYFLLMLN